MTMHTYTEEERIAMGSIKVLHYNEHRPKLKVDGVTYVNLDDTIEMKITPKLIKELMDGEECIVVPFTLHEGAYLPSRVYTESEGCGCAFMTFDTAKKLAGKSRMSKKTKRLAENFLERINKWSYCL